MSRAEFLISGATGRTGSAAIDTLLQMGKSVRAYVRNDDERADVLRARGVDIAVGDFTGIDKMRSAMEGIKGTYFLHPIAPGHPECRRLLGSGREGGWCSLHRQHVADLRAARCGQSCCPRPLDFGAGLRLVGHSFHSHPPHVYH